MGVPSFCNELRHFSGSRHLRSLIATSLPKPFLPFPSICSPDSDPNLIMLFTSSTARGRAVHGGTSDIANSRSGLRSFSSSSRNALSSKMRNSHAQRKKFSEIVEMIRRNDSDLERELNLITVSLSVASITRIFQALNSEKVSAFRFFNWIRDSRPGLRRNFDICSLVIDNFGRLNDYESMICILKVFRKEQVCLTQNAFRFLPELVFHKDLLMNSVTQVVKMLNGIGGSCGASGVRSLIELFSSLGSLEMARFVMQMTGTNTSYYNIMIREMCRKCDLEAARGLLDEMKQVGCEPDTTSCNFVLSIICKNGESAEVLVRAIEEIGCSPDETTFEILVLQSCKLERFDSALGFVDKMLSLGLIPRLSTHAAIIKAYFASQRYEDAHRYVVDSSVKHRQASNVVYSLLAGLLLKKGRAVDALNILLEMIEKDLRPHFRVYRDLLQHLRRSGRNELAKDLERKFSSLSSRTTTETSDL